ncbi:MAG TPA: SMC family ATPase [Dehalococcoidia bacterium]
MRPTKLTIQGLTAYKQPVEIDFTDLDLFAITGPTGAGKSSLVDAITFALYGKAPRVGNSVKELISQGEERLKVTLEFTTNGNKYRIYRSAARKGQAPVQLEHFERERDEWVPEEVDRVRDTNAFVEELLQMDYEAFVRSVLLPQGQFQEFLAGDRDQRRKVLDGLLRLNVYGLMQQRANTIAAQQTVDADRIHKRLDEEMKDATPEALRSAKADLKQLKTRAAELATLRETADAAWHTAEALAEAQRRERDARAKYATAGKTLAKATKLLEGGNLLLAGLDARISALAAEIKAAEYDGDLHLRLTKCLPLLKQMEDAATREAGLTADIEKQGREVEKLRGEVDAAKAVREKTMRTVAVRYEEYDAARHTNAAVLLRQGLVKGDPCPVCGQHVGALFEGKHLALDKIKGAHDKAKADEAAAATKLATLEKRFVGEERELTTMGKQLTDVQGQRAAVVADLAAVSDEAGLTVASVDKRIEALLAAKTKRAELEIRQQAVADRLRDEETSIERARTSVAELKADAKTAETEAARAATDAATATSRLREASGQMAWDDVVLALDAGRDVVPILRRKQTEAHSEESRVNQSIGAAGKQVEQIAANIEKAKALREQEKTSREEATLARDLASLLRTDSFPTFLRQRAMKVLATAGSEQLRIISGGRYDLIADGQDFAVEDIWNASEPRPVRTLSGGETFLASLALALALAEHLPSLAGSGHQRALESLFIDEGFSHLDAETLDTVASALELLGEDRNRLIGVVTHVPALAERMPARITVHKSQAGSTVTVE